MHSLLYWSKLACAVTSLAIMYDVRGQATYDTACVHRSVGHHTYGFLLPSGVGIQLGASIVSGRAGHAMHGVMLAAAMHANDDDWPYIWPAINIQCK